MLLHLGSFIAFRPSTALPFQIVLTAAIYDPYDSRAYYMTKIARSNSQRKPFLEYFRLKTNKTNYQGK